ncbi:hypothetical protein [Mycolicibacterium celeriflavum]|uniref:hypothetical protein n=1 Tax=Mycolicibacterium celeriflavum TaxID=1249101 RepID=UPI003CF958BC
MADWLRSPPGRLLLWAAFAMCLILGAAVVITGREGARPDHPTATFSDEEAAAQVVTAARRAVAAAQLQRPTGGYAFMPCGASDGPPFQAVLHMTFSVPQANSARHVDDIATALVADGWDRSAAEGERFGLKLTGEGVTALVTRDPRRPDSATMRLYGECRVADDHSDDDPVWTEVTL